MKLKYLSGVWNAYTLICMMHDDPAELEVGQVKRNDVTYFQVSIMLDANIIMGPLVTASYRRAEDVQSTKQVTVNR